MEHPTGTVTFLFTDIEGSTGRWETQTAEMRDALAAHDATLRSAIEAHGGWLFKHTGDGVLAAFSSARNAVDAAVEAQRALQLPVRMGLATGEAELRDGDYFGPTLNRASRVESAGHGGQVLVANSTAALLDGVDLLDLGEHRLRDLSTPQRIFQVRAEGLREKFPPLRTLDTTPGNLRVQATSFVGREAEVAELVASVQAHRLVTLTGVGGVGKTRLALQVAAELAPEFPDGVWLIELAPVGDPAAVPDAVATVLGITQQAGMSVAESVAETLAGRLRLLVLDNCEHVLDAVADLVEQILARSATVKVLATSREGLRVPAEHLWPVPSLDVREGLISTAVTLFVERARAAVPGFGLKGGSADAVVEICRRLDGIPLAIELAAARMVSMSPADVRDRLDDRFRLLSGSRRGLERHQTLRHAVQWSYDLLEDDERNLLNRCSVFAGGFDLGAAVEVGGAGKLDEYGVLDLLDALVRKSLLTVERSGGRARYGTLETIRQFAEDQLAASSTSDDTRDRHARHFAGKEDEILNLWNSPKQREAYDWLDRELPNLRAAFRWAADQGDLDTAAPIAIFASFVGCFARRFEPFGWAEDLLEAASASDHKSLAALHLMASLCSYTGRAEDALRHGEASLALIDDRRYDAPPFGYAHNWVGLAYLYAGRPDRHLELNRTELRRSGDPLVLARINIVLGLGIMRLTDEALAMAVDSVAAAENGGNPACLAFALEAYGTAFRDADPPRALAALRQGLIVARDTGNRYFEALIAMWLALVEDEHGDRRTALDLFDQAIDLFHDSGDALTLTATFGSLVVTFDRAGRQEIAARLFGASNSTLTAAIPEIPEVADRLRAALGQQVFDGLTREGAAMERADVVRYAHEQIQLAREELGVAP
jgi:predicted ATPase